MDNTIGGFKVGNHNVGIIDHDSAVIADGYGQAILTEGLQLLAVVKIGAEELREKENKWCAS